MATRLVGTRVESGRTGPCDQDVCKAAEVVEQRGCQLFLAEAPDLLGDCYVAGDYRGAALLEVGEHLEGQLGTGPVEAREA
ncbi:MAG: hypothetical protein F4X83_10365 [Chloroflexi bacterium]|nr:hypothetical protein [Chloroflexota bacterium]